MRRIQPDSQVVIPEVEVILAEASGYEGRLLHE